MRHLCMRAVAGVCLVTALLTAAGNRDHTIIYDRLICVVPLVGSGTARDPKRPEFTQPAPDTAGAVSVNGHGRHGKKAPDMRIIAFQSILTDDGQAAIVMFVARNYAAFKPILSSPDVIRKFERKNTTEQDLVKELRKYKKDFDLKMPRVGAL